MKKKNKKKIKYHEPPMKYNVGLLKFEPNLPIIENNNIRDKDIRNEIQINPIIIVILIILGIMVYIISKIY